MSTSGPGRREVAHRVFAAEFEEATLSYSESDEERAPNYVVTPTGARINRLFAAGVLTAVDRVNDETVRGRIADPTGAFVTYAGQYQPEVQTAIEATDVPSFVALTGKARTFEPEDSDVVYTSIRPESLSTIDESTRDHWLVSAARSTLERIGIFDAALDSEYRGDALEAALSEAGTPPSLAAGIPRAIDHYGTDRAYLESMRTLAIDALELVAGDRETVEPPSVEPDDPTPTTVGSLPDTEIRIDDSPADHPSTTVDSDVSATEPDTERAPIVESDATVEGDSAAESGAVVESNGTEESDVTDRSEDAIADESDDHEPIETVPEESADSPTEASGDVDEDDPADVGEGSLDSLDGELYELDESEREAVESTYGTEFSTGNEVDDPGEADIDTPAPAQEHEFDDVDRTDDSDDVGLADDSDDGDLTAFQDTVASDSATADRLVDDQEFDHESEADQELADGDTFEVDDDDQPEDDDQPGEPTADVNLEDVVIDVMGQLDGGEGVDSETLVAEITDEYGVDREAVTAAIDDALMSGRCYEPEDGRLKPI